MWVEAVLSKDDLASLIAQIVPLTIRINADTGADQYIEIGTASNLALVADQGLRMTAEARIHWPVLGITVPIKIDSLSVMIKPQITSAPGGGDALSFALQIDQAEFAGILALGDQPITDKINSELGKLDLAWAFATMLSHQFKVPTMLEPLDSLALQVAWGKVRVTDEAMVLAISFQAEVSRADQPVAGQDANGSSLAIPRSRALVNRAPRYRTPDMKQVALVGGAALAGVGAYFTVRSAARAGAKLLRRAFSS